MEIYSTKGVHFPNGFPQVVKTQSHTPFTMRTTHEKHMLLPKQADRLSQAQDPAKSFLGVLQKTLEGIEKASHTSHSLSTRAVYAPDSVEAHQVLLAAEKTRFSLNFTKALSDGLVRTFRELTAPR